MGSFWFVGLVVLPHITRSPVMSTTLFICMVHFEFEFTHKKSKKRDGLALLHFSKKKGQKREVALLHFWVFLEKAERYLIFQFNCKQISEAKMLIYSRCPFFTLE